MTNNWMEMISLTYILNVWVDNDAFTYDMPHLK